MLSQLLNGDLMEIMEELDLGKSIELGDVDV